ncbi:MAG: glycosyltransferase [Limisphaerales bacterium]
MKVLFVSNLFPDATDPVRGRINATLLRHLSKKAEVRVVGLRPSLPFVGKNFDNLRPCPEDEILKPVYRTVIYIPKVGSRVNHRLLAKRAAITLHRVQKDFDYDIILCSWLYPDVCGIARLLKSLKVPLVGISQGSDAHQYLENKFRRKLIVRTLNRIGGTITRSKDLATRLAGAGVKEDKLHPIYNGVDTETFRAADQLATRQELDLPPDRKIILYVGNFLPIKNPLLLVRSHNELTRKASDHPPLLVMIGAGELRDEIESTSTQAHVKLVGQKPSAEVAKYMQAADMLCIPSDNEGVPNVAFEAMACGLPIIATKVGGIPEVVAEDFLGTLVERRSLAEMTKAIDDHLQNPRDRAQIASHAEQFSWDRTTDAYLEVLNQSSSQSPR